MELFFSSYRSFPSISSPGRTGVFSTRTDPRAWGSSPRRRRIVGATCAVVTGLFNVLAGRPGFETIRPTFVSL